MTDRQREGLQKRISLLDYLEQQGWKPTRHSGSEEVAGLRPLHRETYRQQNPLSARSLSNSCYGGSSASDPISKNSSPAQKPKNRLRLAT